MPSHPGVQPRPLSSPLVSALTLHLQTPLVIALRRSAESLLGPQRERERESDSTPWLKYTSAPFQPTGVAVRVSGWGATYSSEIKVSICYDA